MRGRIVRLWLVALWALLAVACDVHEFPDPPQTVDCVLRLHYDTQLQPHIYHYNDTTVIYQGEGESYDNRQDYGRIRTVVRAYPATEKVRAGQGFIREFEFTHDVNAGYDQDLPLSLPAGQYQLMVWSQFIDSDAPRYDAANFAEIKLLTPYAASDNRRDAFRGVRSVTLTADIVERPADVYEVEMQRPLAKYEFITTDLKAFMEKEATRLKTQTKAGDDDWETRISMDDYKVEFQFVGFVPVAYNMFTDKPNDSQTEFTLCSSLKRVGEEEASLGFDYVFVNGKQSALYVRIAIYDAAGELLSLTNPIEVPVKRSQHTVMRGVFLMKNASSGVNINPDYWGDHNVYLRNKK